MSLAPNIAPEPWTRQQDETPRQYECFCIYRDLGPGRSLDAAYRKELATKAQQKRNTRATGTWTRWYTSNQWKSRAEAWDQYLDEQKRQAAAEEWRKRGEALVEEQWGLSKALMKKAFQMLSFPLAEKTVEKKDKDANPIEVTVQPAGWRMRDAASLAKVGVEMAVRCPSPTRDC